MDYIHNFNKYQTKLSVELLEKLPKDIVESLIDYIENVPLINWLVQPENIRGYIKDRPYMLDIDDNIDSRGRRLIDVTKPHILENMDYFRQPAIFFEKNGRYTNITPNPNPKSEYANFWRDELKKWKEGLVREDGEWIPGLLYFYWNYAPIWLVEKTERNLTPEEWLNKILNSKDTKTKKKQKGERKRQFAKPWLGDYLFYHYVDQAMNLGQHGKLLKTRGCGFSFKLGAISPCNMYIKPGSGNPNFHLASEKTFLEGDKGIWGKVIDTLDWVAANTPLPKIRLVNGVKSMEIQLGYQDEYGSRKGLLSSVFGISLKDNPDKARGIRGPLIHYEEDGLFPNLEKAWNVNRKAVEDGDTSFGFMLSGGTGGTEGATFEGSEKLFYSPRAYNIYALKNVYDKKASNECGFFWGAYINRNDCYDEINGEPDVIKSLLEILIDRKNIKENSSDPSTILQRMAEEPLVPQEAVMRVQGSFFPVYQLKQVEAELLTNLKELENSWIGIMEVDSKGKVRFKVTPDVKVIDKFPHNEQKPGAIQIWEHPIEDSNGTIPRFRYIAGCDPVDDDGSETSSLLSTWIMNTLTKQIVAEYTGRPQITEEYFEQLRLLMSYYGISGTLNYENNKKALYGHFKNKDSLYMLCETPEILRGVANITINKIGNKKYGTPASKTVNNWGLSLIKSWLLEPCFNQPEDRDEPLLNLHTIKSPAFLRELITYHSEGNFDRISAFGMLLILYEDAFKQIQNQTTPQQNPVALDPFWKKQFKSNSYGTRRLNFPSIDR